MDLGLLFDLRARDNLHPYAGVVLRYTHNQSTFVGTTHGAGGEALFGLRYMFVKRVGVFGELGAQYLKQDVADVKTYGVFTGALGLTIYVK
jgi:hypothetical protein